MNVEEAALWLKRYQGYEPFENGTVLKHSFDLTDETVDVILSAIGGASIGEPLTPEQLREMDGQPVFVKMKTIHELTGWAIVHVDYQMGTIRLWGKIGNWLRYQTDDMEIYAYPPAQIDREAWEPCQGCGSKCLTCAVNETRKCTSCKNAKNYLPLYKYCPKCGRPLIEEAWDELEKRLRR